MGGGRLELQPYGEESKPLALTCLYPYVLYVLTHESDLWSSVMFLSDVLSFLQWWWTFSSPITLGVFQTWWLPSLSAAGIISLSV